MKKKVFVWIHLPCLDGMGSCTYDDVCSIIPKLKCPSVFQQYHIPCKCPIAAVSFFDNVVLDIEVDASFFVLYYTAGNVPYFSGMQLQIAG